MSTKRKRYLPATSIVGAQKRRLTNSSMPGAPNAADGPGPLLHYVPVLYAQGRAVCLGQGGYGSVFRYKDTLAGQDVAIKRVQLTNLPEHKRELLSRYIPSE
jgi:hypothetical protein